MRPLYLDNAASTRIAEDVLAAMAEVMRTAWGNPSAQHPQGAAARSHIETARRRLLVALGDTAQDRTERSPGRHAGGAVGPETAKRGNARKKMSGRSEGSDRTQ